MRNLPELQSKVMDDDTLSKHRAFIAVKAQSLMGRYFQLPQDEMVKRDILLGWMNMLQDFTRGEIERACSKYLIEYPSKRPHEGLVYGLIINERKRTVSMQPRAQIAPPLRKEPDANMRKKISDSLMSAFRK
jgi:hypothetical protein